MPTEFPLRSGDLPVGVDSHLKRTYAAAHIAVYLLVTETHRHDSGNLLRRSLVNYTPGEDFTSGGFKQSKHMPHESAIGLSTSALVFIVVSRVVVGLIYEFFSCAQQTVRQL